MIEKMIRNDHEQIVVNWAFVDFAVPCGEGAVVLHFGSKDICVLTTIDYCFEQMGTACGFTQEREPEVEEGS